MSKADPKKLATSFVTSTAVPFSFLGQLSPALCFRIHMISLEKKQWCQELIKCGNLSENQPEEVIQQKIERYWFLIDMIDGSEDQEIFNAILDSIQDEGATEAYESSYNALWKFPPEHFSKFFVAALPSFIDRINEEAGRFLLGLLGWAVDSYLPCFNNALAIASKEEQSKIMKFVHKEENGGWFEGSSGYIKPERM